MDSDYPLDYTIKVSKRLKLIRQLESDLQRVHLLINRCDQKASILLASIGVFITLIVKSIIDNNSSESASNLKPLSYLFSISYNELDWWIYFCLFLTIVLICISFLFLLLTILARTNTENNYNRNNCKTYFKDISNLKLYDFKTQRKNATEDERIDELISQLYVNSLICNKKYGHYKTALVLFLLGFIFLMVGFVLFFI